MPAIVPFSSAYRAQEPPELATADDPLVPTVLAPVLSVAVVVVVVVVVRAATAVASPRPTVRSPVTARAAAPVTAVTASTLR